MSSPTYNTTYHERAQHDCSILQKNYPLPGHKGLHPFILTRMILPAFDCGPLCIYVPSAYFGKSFISLLHINWRLSLLDTTTLTSETAGDCTCSDLPGFAFGLCTCIIHFFFTLGALFSPFLRVSVSWAHLAARCTRFVTEGTRLAREAFRCVRNSCKKNSR